MTEANVFQLVHIFARSFYLFELFMTWVISVYNLVLNGTYFIFTSILHEFDFV